MIRQVMVSASILASDFNCLGEEVRRVTAAGADFIHIDVMDGHFVPNITIGPSVVKALRKSSQLPFDVHLMIENPENYVDSFIKAGANLITVHQEATKHLQKIVKTIKEQGVKAGVAINPATPLVTLEEILTDSDLVLIMSVNPGFAGQDFIPSSINIAFIFKSRFVSASLLRILRIVRESFPPLIPTTILSFLSINLNCLIVLKTFFSKYFVKQELHKEIVELGRIITGFVLQNLHILAT